MNQNPMIAVSAEANKVDKIGVTQRVEHQHASKKLAVALLR
jgi:hypothetical protein